MIASIKKIDLPCVKCILLPVCKNKETINCNILYNLYDDLYKSIVHSEVTFESYVNVQRRINILRLEIKKVLDNIKILSIEEGYLSYDMNIKLRKYEWVEKV